MDYVPEPSEVLEWMWGWWVEGAEEVGVEAVGVALEVGAEGVEVALEEMVGQVGICSNHLLCMWRNVSVRDRRSATALPAHSLSRRRHHPIPTSPRSIDLGLVSLGWYLHPHPPHPTLFMLLPEPCSDSS